MNVLQNAGKNGGACSCNTLPKQSSLVYTNDVDEVKKMLRNKPFSPTFCSLISNRLNMREQGPGANLLRERVTGLSSLVCTSLKRGSKKRKQKFCCATFFLLEIISADEGALLRQNVAEANCSTLYKKGF